LTRPHHRPASNMIPTWTPVKHTSGTEIEFESDYSKIVSDLAKDKEHLVFRWRQNDTIATKRFRGMQPLSCTNLLQKNFRARNAAKQRCATMQHCPAKCT